MYQTHLNYYYSYDISKFNMAKVLCFLFLFLCLTASTVFCNISHQSDHVNTHLISEVLSIHPGRSFSVGVLLELEKGWHTYWSKDWSVRSAINKNHVLLSISSPTWFKNQMTDIYFYPEQSELFDYSSPQYFEKTEDGYAIRAKLSTLAQKIPLKLQGVLVSDKSWSRDSENRALRIAVPFAQHKKEDKKTQKEVSR